MLFTGIAITFMDIVILQYTLENLTMHLIALFPG